MVEVGKSIGIFLPHIFLYKGGTKLYQTIKALHKAHPYIPEYRLRVWLKEGKLPGFWSGHRYLVDVEKLMARLDALCENCGRQPE